ncbi:hypothetical protein [Amycolatopsis taiwanensis]|uniref:hypothetical protein n=1 Tax=Amycolatopsis taiwanensis TaxID=342230 RepID=UPI0004840016|nr:hypothetical protein [Amycolatopsis taiwanensis]
MTTTEKPEHVRQAEALERIAVMIRANPGLHLPGLSMRLHLVAPHAAVFREFARLAPAYADRVYRRDGREVAVIETEFGPVELSVQTELASLAATTVDGS